MHESRDKRQGMPDFRFLHAADIHLDSPLHGLSRYDGVPVDEVRGATRAAFDNLVGTALDEVVDFVVIAGDLFDGDWKDMGTALYFARAMGRLDAMDIPVFLIAGNHDAGSVLTRSVPWPPNVRSFGSRRPESHRLGHLGVAVHGQSFANAAVTDNLATGYPAADPHAFNIGVLHTALAGHPGHANYAPCSVADLAAKGYDYWALGHVHDYQLACADPPVVFPGNLQGRNIRETGPKGAVLVEVSDRAVTAMTRVELDVLRWARVEVDCAGADDIDAVRARIRDAMAQGHAAQAGGRPVVARVILTGETPLAGDLADRDTSLRDDVRALAAAISPELWLEKLSIHATPPVAPPVNAELGDDIAALLTDIAADPDLAAALANDLQEFLSATATALGDAEPDTLRAAADAGDWSRLIDASAAALHARLAGG